MYAIETYNISYEFDKKLILNDICLQIPSGSVYGFIGPNGAGKSTTIKAILGLIPNLKSSVSVFESNLKDNFKVLRKIGSLIERPSLYEHLSAHDNLKIYQMILQVSKGRILDVLRIVGLQDEEYKKIKEFSLGMKQRLGIAIALLGDPEIIILDEPINGLDPNGIRDFRSLIKMLHSQNKTIIISSHLLSELETISTNIGIIDKGKLIFQGTIEELKNRNKKNLVLKVVETEKLKSILNYKQIRFAMDLNSAFVIENLYEDFTNVLIQILFKEKINIISLNNTKSLEDFYFEITE